MHVPIRLLLLLLTIFLAAGHASAQSFEETWKEFLDNNKVSNISALLKPDRYTDTKDYSKYLLMNMNSSLCQSEITKADDLLADLKDLDAKVYEAIPGFAPRLEGLELKAKAYYQVDDIWKDFLVTRNVPTDKLEAIEAVKTTCEKSTLAKYSYMRMYASYCGGDIRAAKNIFENRTLRLAEKTSWKLQDVKGMAPEVAKMSKLFALLPELDRAWETYVKTGTSPGFAPELPVVDCNPTPNVKEWILKGLAEPCETAPAMLAKITQLQNETGLKFEDETSNGLIDLEDLAAGNNQALADLNEAWAAFLPDNKVKYGTKYGYDYCSTEPLIKAYIMDGYTFVCELADFSSRRIDSLQKIRRVRLDDVTKEKIVELAKLESKYRFNGSRIESVWDEFVADGDVLSADYISTDQYCDQIQEVKDWTIRGLSGDCEAGVEYLNKIEEFNQKFEFKFFQDLECRVQKLRIKVYDCRSSLLEEIATLEAEQSSYEQRLAELKIEYGMAERPEACEGGQ